MPTFEIELDDGRKFHVDADNHDAAVAGLHAHIGGAPAQSAAEKAVAQAPNGYLPFLNDMAHRVTQGMTLGWNDEMNAGLRSIAPNTTYAKEKAIQNAIEERAKQNTGMAGTAAEILGGLATGGAAAKGGATLVREGQSLIPRILGSATEGAAYGSASGAGEADGNRMGGAANGALAGAAFGGGLTAGAAGLGAAKAATISNVMSRIDPEGAARAQVGKAFSRTGMTPQEIEAAVQQGKREGNTGFTYADVNPAVQDMFEGLMQSPGAGRSAAIPWLYGRQAEHGRRMTGFVEDALLRSPQAKKTAKQYVADKTEARDQLADVLWPQAREGATGVDVSGALNKADELLAPGFTKGMSPGSTLPDDSIEAVIRKAKGLLANDQERLTNFSSVAQAKRDIQAIHENNRSARYITGPMLKELDAALENASSGYRKANDIFARQSKAIEAVDTGKQMARSGRPEDTIPAYQNAPAAQQRAMRVGYADQTVTPFYGSKTKNYANDVTGPGVAAEIEAMAGPERAALLQRQALRENQMRSTLDKSVGNSATVRRANQGADLATDPRVFGVLANLKGGNWGAAVGDLGHMFGHQLTGNTEAMRNEAIRLLLGGNVNIPAHQPGMALKMLQKLGYPKASRPATDIPGLLSDAASQARSIDKLKTRAKRAAIQAGAPQFGVSFMP